MIGPIRRTLTLIVLSVRDMLVSAGPVVLLAVGVLVAAYWWLDPQPPRTVTLATGPAGSAYAEIGERYAQALARNGIAVTLLPTQGLLAKLQALRQGTAGAAFVRGGSADAQPDGEAGITSLQLHWITLACRSESGRAFPNRWASRWSRSRTITASTSMFSKTSWASRFTATRR